MKRLPLLRLTLLRLTLLPLIFALLTANAFAQTPAATTAAATTTAAKRMTIEDALALRTIGAPQWSPDGKLIAFTVSDWNRKENRRDSHVYVVAASGGAPVRLTNGERGETAPQWSPDSTRLAFLANRDTPRNESTPTSASRGNQIYIIPVAGGEAERLTDEEAGVVQFRWSPDNQQVAYVVRDTPQDKAERDKRRKDRFDAIVVDDEFTYSHLWRIDVKTKDRKRVTEGKFTVSDPQWSPDARRLAYVVSRGGVQDSSFTDISDDRITDIFIFDIAGSTAANTATTNTAAAAAPPRQLTTNPGFDANPRWSPDGKSIAYLASTEPTAWATKTDLYILSVDGNTAPRNLSDKYEDSVTGAPDWSPDGAALYAPGVVGVYGQLLKIPVAGGEARKVFEEPGGFSGVNLSPDGTRLAFLFEEAMRPGDIFIAAANGKGATRLTNLNPQTLGTELGTTEVVRWKSADELEIEGILIKPVGYEAGKRYPTILQIHGGPYARFSYGFEARAQIFAANGYAVLMPNPRGSLGYGSKFTNANVRDWGGKDFQDLMVGVDELVKMGIADPERLGVMGGSYGGFMTFWAITQTNRFKAAIGHAGISDWYSFYGQSDIPGLMEYGFGGTPWTARETYTKFSPVSYVERVKTPLMITHGEQDRRVPVAQAEQYYRLLKKRGAPVTFIRYPREGHGITEPNHVIDLVQRQLAWFDKHVKGTATAANTSTARSKN